MTPAGSDNLGESHIVHLEVFSNKKKGHCRPEDDNMQKKERSSLAAFVCKYDQDFKVVEQVSIEVWRDAMRIYH